MLCAVRNFLLSVSSFWKDDDEIFVLLGFVSLLFTMWHEASSVEESITYKIHSFCSPYHHHHRRRSRKYV